MQCKLGDCSGRVTYEGVRVWVLEDVDVEESGQ